MKACLEIVNFMSNGYIKRLSPHKIDDFLRYG